MIIVSKFLCSAIFLFYKVLNIEFWVLLYCIKVVSELWVCFPIYVIGDINFLLKNLSQRIEKISLSMHFLELD